MANEKRLIDANLLIGICEEIAKHEWNKRVSPVSWSDAYEGFIDTIEEMPTVDAVEVVHGVWMGKTGKWWCSVCKKGVPYSYTGHNYCPNCGAKMDGDGNED